MNTWINKANPCPDNIEEGEMKIVEFVEEGAIFTFTNRTTNVFVERLDKPEAWPADSEYKNTFKEEGFVMRYEYTGPDEKEVHAVGYELKVRFSSDHVIRAGNITKLKLGINFTLSDDAWKDVTPADEKDKVYEPFGKWLGYFRVIIRGDDAMNRVGGDPMIAWGP
jgi:hypothetical protein